MTVHKLVNWLMTFIGFRQKMKLNEELKTNGAKRHDDTSKARYTLSVFTARVKSLLTRRER